ncbi:MAG: hypothetical protein Pg6C_14700 [Treponemataceae bacterium]|nr:MAG: hypothetical protein Pg6C_14700 [Treponemataceae bacterium]
MSGDKTYKCPNCGECHTFNWADVKRHKKHAKAFLKARVSFRQKAIRFCVAGIRTKEAVVHPRQPKDKPFAERFIGTLQKE